MPENSDKLLAEKWVAEMVRSEGLTADILAKLIATYRDSLLTPMRELATWWNQMAELTDSKTTSILEDIRAGDYKARAKELLGALQRGTETLALSPGSAHAAREAEIRLLEAKEWKAHRPGDGFYDRRVNELETQLAELRAKRETSNDV